METVTSAGALESKSILWYPYVTIVYMHTNKTVIQPQRLRAFYSYGYGRIAATTTGVLQAYYGRAAGCKLTSGHYSCNCER